MRFFTKKGWAWLIGVLGFTALTTADVSFRLIHDPFYQHHYALYLMFCALCGLVSAFVWAILLEAAVAFVCSFETW